MDPMTLFFAFNIVERIGISFAVGASTFALIFFFKAMEDGVIDASEKNFMHAVYFVLRIGMTLVILSMLATLAYAANLGDYSLLDASFLFKAILLVVIMVNALLMDKRVMPMSIGPAIAGGSWYSYFIWSLIQDTSAKGNFSLIGLLACYAAFVIALGLFLGYLRKAYLGQR